MIASDRPVPTDPLFELAARCAADPRPEKLDLILGVYRDDDGRSPVMAAVHRAEERLAQAAGSKEYVGLSGSAPFNTAMTRLVLDDDALVARATTVQTVAGSGALRMLAELLAQTQPGRTIHLGVPAYVNHPGIFERAGLRVAEYAMSSGGYLDRAAVVRAASRAERGDALLLQGCCHNPTGLTMPFDLWVELADICAARGVVPFIDHAYFGLGEGLDDDFAGMRHMLRVVPEAVVAVSGSKAWSLYSERAGCAIVLTAPDTDADARERLQVRSMLEMVGREAYSQPPAHGANVITEVLADPELRRLWLDELDGMRARLTQLREGLIAELARLGFADTAVLEVQRGMFLRLPLSAEQMERLSRDHAVYGAPSGRINLAGVPRSRVAEVASAIAAVAGVPSFHVKHDAAVESVEIVA